MGYQCDSSLIISGETWLVYIMQFLMSGLQTFNGQDIVSLSNWRDLPREADLATTLVLLRSSELSWLEES